MTNERAAELRDIAEVALDCPVHPASGYIEPDELLELIKDRERMEKAERLLKKWDWEEVSVDYENLVISACYAWTTTDNQSCVVAPTLREALDKMPEGNK